MDEVLTAAWFAPIKRERLASGYTPARERNSMSLRCVLRCPIKFVSSAIFCGALLLPAVARGQATRYKDAPPLLLGAAWYPEQWDDATIDHDLDTMEAAHIHLARVAEFAWSSMEPSEGRYDWTWLDRAGEKAGKQAI